MIPIRRRRALPLVLLVGAALLFLGCPPDEQCQKAKEFVTGACKGDDVSSLCIAARQAQVAACPSAETAISVRPTPTPIAMPCPIPTPTPPPAMTGPRCVDIGAPCNCIDFPPPGTPTCVVCDPAAPGGVRNVGTVPACPPTSGPGPTPTPTPPAGKCDFPQGVPDEQFVKVANPATLSALVDDTIREHTSCSGHTDCTWGPEDPQHYLAVMVEALRAKGKCAGQHSTGHSDQISVADGCAPGVVWQNYQPVNFGGDQHKARFAPANIMDGWTVPVGCTSPTPPPPQQTQCAPAVTGFRDVHELSRAGNRINFNTTPEQCDNITGSLYCKQVWSGRQCCPLGPGEGAERAACEAQLVGHIVVTPTAGNIERADYNPDAPMLGMVFTASPWTGGKVKVCAEKAPAVCGLKFADGSQGTELVLP